MILNDELSFIPKQSTRTAANSTNLCVDMNGQTAGQVSRSIR